MRKKENSHAIPQRVKRMTHISIRTLHIPTESENSAKKHHYIFRMSGSTRKYATSSKKAANSFSRQLPRLIDNVWN